MHGNTKDLIGQRFGLLTVISQAESDKNNHASWLCKCDCGNKKIALGTNLLKGSTKSCGCLKKQKQYTAKRYEDLTGRRFGKLEIITFAGKLKNGEVLWECRCDCGNTSIVRTSRLKSGITTSCGCKRSEAVVHGFLCGCQKNMPRLYRIWAGMKQRCYNPNRPKYKNYGGRGILVCKEWKNNFTLFHKWALTHGYKDDLTIDRIDNDKGYFPENCRWISVSENSYHRWEHEGGLAKQ